VIHPPVIATPPANVDVEVLIEAILETVVVPALNVFVKRVEEVAFVVVELRPVKFCKVDEPVARRFEIEISPASVAVCVFGSNQNGAVVVEFVPIAIMSVLLFE